MKKLYSFALVLLVLMSSVILSACRTNYDNLSMSFVSSTGASIERVELNIDKVNLDMNNDTIRLGVRFDGIDSSDIGNIIVQSRPSGLVTVTDYVYQENIVYFTVRANSPTVDGTLEVMHYSSEKTSSCPLYIGQKSSDITVLSNRYIISIPESGSKESIIDISSLIKLYPNGSTDNIFFTEQNNMLPQNVEFLSTSVDGTNYITGFRLNNSVLDGASITLYPVTYMNNYSPTIYSSQPIEFVFKRVLNSDEVVFSSDSSHIDYINSNQPIYLIENDDSAVNVGGQTYNYNNLKISLMQQVGEELFSIDDYLDFYDYEFSSTNENIKPAPAGEGIVIVAYDYTNDIETVTISLVPKDCVGEIARIDKTIRVKGETRPEDISVRLQGEIIDASENIDLYDYYVNSINSMGALFQFTPVETYAMQDFKSMQLSITPEILNAYISLGGTMVGLNPIYSDDSFTTQVTDSSLDTGSLRNNQYVLDIFIENQPMRFYYDETSGKMLSETFYESNSIYIRYSETNIATNNYELGLDVVCFYSGNLDYLSQIQPTTISLRFNREEGVTNLIVNAGSVSINENNSVEISTIENESGGFKLATDVYLNRLNGMDNSIDSSDNRFSSSILYVGTNGVIGFNNRILTEASFVVSVTGGQDNPLKLKQYDITTDGNGKNVQGMSSIVYNFSQIGGANQGQNNAILLVFDKNTDIGEYTITFTHANGYTFVINCYIYQDLTTSDINYTLETNSTAFRNSLGENDYLFDDYTADYIVASGQNLDFEVVLDSVFLNNYVTGYNLSVGNYGASAINVQDYLTISSTNNFAVLRFLKGSFINGENVYFALNVTVNVRNYSDILTENGTKQISRTITFFIYEEIANDDIFINTVSPTLYVYDQLGVYYKDQSKIELVVGLRNGNLWNYVQAYSQNDEILGIGNIPSDETEESEDTAQNLKRVVWTITNSEGYEGLLAQEQTDNSLTIRAVSSQYTGQYTRTLVAVIRQFNTEFSFVVQVTVCEPIISERLEITSNVSVRDNGIENPYINLRAGETYQISANNYSIDGSVTNPDIFVVVSDRFGNSDYDSVSVDQATNTITVHDEITASNGLKIIVFARDALGDEITAYSQGFNDPQSYIMEGLDELTQNRYKNAYFVIDLILSDGSKENPYLIENGDDFWMITEDTDAHYRLMTNVDISNTTYTGERVIENFSGSITTDYYIYGENTDNEQIIEFSYSLFGIVLTESNPNLFVNFSGQIENITFSVTYNYNFTTNINSSSITNIYLGVFDTITNQETQENPVATLTNVSVSASGNASFNSTDNFIFGSLVGRNGGDINYTSNSVIGANVNLQLSGSSQVYFGGLVGENVGSILGYSEQTASESTLNLTRNNAEPIDNEVIFSVLIAGEGAMSNITIDSTLSNANSAVGGVIGVNSYNGINVGRLTNAYVTGSIVATNNNVGGVIGIQNVGEEITYKVEYSTPISSSANQIKSVGESSILPTLENITSSVQITGNNNVGGVVGADNGAYYKNVHYQIIDTGENSSYLVGITNVGGIAGSSSDGYFENCSVMSYRHDYNNLESTFVSAKADILGNNYVGGIVGLSTSSLESYLNSGSNEVSATLVLNSSVNAHISSNNKVGGLFSLNDDKPTTEIIDGGISLVFNAYFLGKLDGSIYYHSVITGNPNTAVSLGSNSTYVFNIAYSVNVDDSGAVIERSFKYNDVFDIKNSSSATQEEFVKNLPKNWGYMEDLNGGYIFISKLDDAGNKTNEPIYELAPTSLSAIVKDNYKLEDAGTLLHLNYYNFNIDTTNPNYITILNALNEDYNTYNLKDLFDFSYAPESLSEVRIYAVSGNSNVVSISNDELIVNGVGQTTLTFRSILNPQVSATVTVDVSLPIGEDFHLLDGDNIINNGDEQRIALNHAKQYYFSANGEVTYDNENYSYRTNNEVYLRVGVTFNGSVEDDSEIDPFVYLNISGIKPDLDNGETVVLVPYNTPLSISVIEYSENITFNISVQPYTIINYNDQKIRNYVLGEGNSIEFTVVPAFGATNISLDFDHAIMYPNDTTIITAYINTDLQLKDDEIESFVSAIQIDNVNVDISNYIEYLSERTIYNQDTNIQTAYFRLNLENLVEDLKELFGLDINNLDRTITLTVRFTLTNGRSANAEFVVLPQRINKIEINNYIYVNRGADEDTPIEIEKNDVLRPDGQGILLIELAPENGYYDYLEISDITGEEEIVFTQVDGIAGSRIDMNLPSSDGTGIKLVKVNGITYVETRISRDYSTREHTVSVRAYLADGTLLSENRIVIDVRMLPEIQLDYIDPNGVIVRTNTEIDYDHNYYLANGVNADFRVTTDNSDGNVDVTLSLDDNNFNANDYFEFVLDNNGFYTLRSLATPTDANFEDLLGKTLTITVSTRATEENGNFETATTSIKLTIVDFVIHNVSVSNSRVTFNSNMDNISRMIYGDYGVPVQLEFYLNPTDISFYNSEVSDDNFWNQTYRYDATLSADEDESLKAINDILKELNTSGVGGSNKFISLSYGTEEDKENLTLSGNTLTVTSGNHSTSLRLQFKLELDANNGYIWKMSENTSEDISNTSPNLIYAQNYSLEFVNSNSFEDPIVIVDEEDFINMESGENVYYILANDLTLSDYTPLDVNFRMFDGNGHTITIQSFDMFGEAEIRAGLFREIYDGMIVANLTVKYDGGMSNSFGSYSVGNSDFSVTYADLCQNPDVNYESADFGGITPVNNGIITNCEVDGMVALSASTIENRTDSTSTSNYNIDFNIGGIVSENGASGYITNSISRLKIFAQANIGGVAHTNSGKIVSSEFDASTETEDQKTGLIYAYNSNVQNTIISSIAGFVVTNSGEISMSNVKVGQTRLGGTSNYIGNMSAKDISSGFVYSNNGSIYDSYVNLTRIGANNNTFSGFVNSNSGSITRVYTYINNGNKSSAVVNMFAPQNTTGITNSIEIVNVTGGYNSRIEGLTTLNYTDRFVLSNYTDLGFIFGDNESAVWKQIVSNTLPYLVVEDEEVTKGHSFSKGNLEDDTDNVDVEIDGVTYSGDILDASGLRAIVVVEVTETDDNNHVTTNTLYATLNNGYGRENNPYLIYDLTSWNNYFIDGTNGYYRLITDIDFSSVYTNPSTSDKTFSGNIQGNNMEISGLTIYSSSSLNSIGLFENLLGSDDITTNFAIRNLKLNASSVLASKTVAVGTLAGISENFKLYNIELDSQGVIVVGKNAVGGIVGIVRGNFDIDGVSSNVGANSTRETNDSSYSIYRGINNGQSTSNLNDVYYAGSVFGMLDGYNYSNYDINETRDIENDTYFEVKNVSTSGSITILGDFVGGMFGFVGERVKVEGATIDISGTLNGKQYSAGAVGENRGVLENLNVFSDSDNMFSASSYVNGGIVGLNLGGMITNSSANINILADTTSSIAGGIVGRNVNGYITNVYQSGNLRAFYTGGIIGTNYSRDVFISRSTGTNSLRADTQIAVVNDELEYTSNSNAVENLSNINISRSTIDYLFENMRLFYSYLSSRNSVDDAFQPYRIFGLLIGAESGNQNYTLDSYGYLTENDVFSQLVINEIIEIIKIDEETQETHTTNNFATTIASSVTIGTIENATLYNGANKRESEEEIVGYNIEFANIIQSSDLSCSYITYLVGANLSGFDNWDRRSYATEKLVFTNATEIDELTISPLEGSLQIYAHSSNINLDNEYVVVLKKVGESSPASLEINLEFMLSYFDENADLSLYLNGSEDEEEDFDITQISTEFVEFSINSDSLTANGKQTTIRLVDNNTNLSYTLIIRVPNDLTNYYNVLESLDES